MSDDDAAGIWAGEKTGAVLEEWYREVAKIEGALAAGLKPNSEEESALFVAIHDAIWEAFEAGEKHGALTSPP